MSSTLSAQTASSTSHRTSGGRFAAGNPGGPGNPFARQTAALRAYLINHVTERDIQDILDILLLNAKGGHLPTIKFLFAYVIGKPKPAVEPDELDLQEMHMLQQGALPTEALETMCNQLPLDFQVQLARFAQTENVATAIQTVPDNQPSAPAPPTPPSAPSPNRNCVEPSCPVEINAPSTNDADGASTAAKRQNPPSTNGKIPRPPHRAGFDWLSELKRAFGGGAAT